MCNCRKKNKVIIQPNDVTPPVPAPIPAPVPEPAGNGSAN